MKCEFTEATCTEFYLTILGNDGDYFDNFFGLTLNLSLVNIFINQSMSFN